MHAPNVVQHDPQNPTFVSSAELTASLEGRFALRPVRAHHQQNSVRHCRQGRHLCRTLGRRAIEDHDGRSAPQLVHELAHPVRGDEHTRVLGMFSRGQQENAPGVHALQRGVQV